MSPTSSKIYDSLFFAEVSIRFLFHIMTMWASRSILLRRRPRLFIRPLSRSYTKSQFTRRRVTAASALVNNYDRFGDSSSLAVAAVLVSAAAALSIHNRDEAVKCDIIADVPGSPFTISQTTLSSISESPKEKILKTQSSSNLNRRKGTMRNQPRNVMLHRMRSVRARNLGEKYVVDWKRVLGEGAYGSVHPGRIASTGEKVALKKISKRYTNSSSFKTETDALLRIFDNGGHPNISGLRDMYEDAAHFYMILDLVSGGEMFEHLIHYGAYSEADAARLMHEIASALAFLHGVGVVHADLKPENLLLCSKQRHDGTIKIIDFGCAAVSDPEPYMYDGDAEEDRLKAERESAVKTAASTGTTAYWPPERFKKGSEADAAMDMWSVGVILYIMLTGAHPFDVRGVSGDDEIENRIKANPNPPLTPEFTSHLSESAIDLITKLMDADPNNRITAYEMLQHPWVRGETATKDKILDSDKKLSHFKDVRQQLEAGIFAVLVSHGHQDVTMSERKKKATEEKGEALTHIMKRAFDVFDAEGKGFITSDDLASVVRDQTGSELSSDDTQQFFATNGAAEGEPSPETKLSLSDFSKLFSGLKHKHFPRGHVIFHAGDIGDAMYFLCSGKIEVQTRKGQLVSMLRSGDFFGEGSLLDEENKRFTTAKCATPVDVIKIKRSEFDRYVASSEKARNELRLKWRARNLSYAKNLIRLQTNVKTLTLKKGDVVYNEGEPGTSMYRVVDGDGGELEVSHGGTAVHKYTEGDSFGESSLLMERPRSSTVTCVSDTCKLHEMEGSDFLGLVNSSPEMEQSLRDMCRKRLFKKAVKAFSLENKGGVSDENIVAAFHDADIDKSGSLSLTEVKALMHRMDPTFPVSEIEALLKFIDVDDDGLVSFVEFKRLFRQFEEKGSK